MGGEITERGVDNRARGERDEIGMRGERVRAAARVVGHGGGEGLHGEQARGVARRPYLQGLRGPSVDGAPVGEGHGSRGGEMGGSEGSGT